MAQGGSISRTFEHTIGLRQGCVISPLLFALFISDLPVYLTRNGCEGVSLQNTRVNSLWYADDGALLASTPASLQRSLDALEQYCSRWRLCVNTIKTKVMACCFSKEGKASREDLVFTYKGASLERVTSFCYLGVPIAEKADFRGAMQHRVAMARRALALWSRRCMHRVHATARYGVTSLQGMCSSCARVWLTTMGDRGLGLPTVEEG